MPGRRACRSQAKAVRLSADRSEIASAALTSCPAPSSHWSGRSPCTRRARRPAPDGPGGAAARGPRRACPPPPTTRSRPSGPAARSAPHRSRPRTATPDRTAPRPSRPAPGPAGRCPRDRPRRTRPAARPADHPGPANRRRPEHPRSCRQARQACGSAHGLACVRRLAVARLRSGRGAAGRPGVAGWLFAWPAPWSLRLRHGPLRSSAIFKNPINRILSLLKCVSSQDSLTWPILFCSSGEAPEQPGALRG